MKKLLLSAAALALLAMPALAQRNDGARRNDGDPPRGTTEQRDRNPERGGMRGPTQPPQQQMAPQAGSGGMPGAERRSGDRGQPQAQQSPQAPPQQPNNMAMQRGDRDNDRNRDNNRNTRGDRYDNNRDRDGRWDRDRGNNGWDNRRGDNRPRADFRRYQRNFAAPQRFRAPAYRRPAGWYAHRWSFGEVLPTAFFARGYWIDNFYSFGLMEPPFGTVWVRYGSDALLIDRYSGEVIQVAYRVFY